MTNPLNFIFITILDFDHNLYHFQDMTSSLIEPMHRMRDLELQH